jgi:hypothetical protein
MPSRIISSGGFVGGRPPVPKYAQRNEGLATVQGLLGQNYHRAQSTSGAAITSGTTKFGLVYLLEGEVISKIWWGCAVVSATVTLTKCGLYDTGGNQLAVSANDIAANTTLGPTGISMVTPYTVPASGPYYMALLVVATTPGSNAGTGSPNGGFQAMPSPYNFVLAAVEAGQTDLDPTVAYTANAGLPWFGWS